MRPWLVITHVERAQSWSVLLFYSWPALTPNRIIWSKSSLGVLSFQNQKQNKKEMHNLRNYQSVRLLLLYSLQWTDANLHQLIIYPDVFPYSWSPLKSSSPGNFPPSHLYPLLNITLNQNGNNTVSLHRKASILANLQRFWWTKWWFHLLWYK